MKKLRWQFVIILLTGLVVGILLINQQQQQQQQQLTPSNPVIATPLPASGGVFTEALIGSLNRLNPLLAQITLQIRM
jgi:peptide/nickel transport system substrate-binding protein